MSWDHLNGPALPAVLADASRQVQRQRDALAALTEEACARRFEVAAHRLFRPGADQKSDQGRRLNMARTCAVSLMHVGAGWTQTEAGAQFGLDRRAAQKAVRRTEDLRADDADLDAWLDGLERALDGKGFQ